jgi:hypothetical protein
MSTTDTIKTMPEPVRGNLLLTGDDAALWGDLCTHLTAKSGKPIKTVDVLRDAIRCYANELGLKVA